MTLKQGENMVRAEDRAVPVDRQAPWVTRVRRARVGHEDRDALMVNRGKAVPRDQGARAVLAVPAVAIDASFDSSMLQRLQFPMFLASVSSVD